MEGETHQPINMGITELLHILLEMAESDFIDLQTKENQAAYFKRLFRHGMLESN